MLILHDPIKLTEKEMQTATPRIGIRYKGTFLEARTAGGGVTRPPSLDSGFLLSCTGWVPYRKGRDCHPGPVCAQRVQPPPKKGGLFLMHSKERSGFL